ncbi:substrate-binding domain-containing protein [Mesorhizobium sp. ORM6]
MTLDQFFTPTVYGIQDACAAFGCSYQWTGSQKNVVSEMVSAMQTAIAQKSDGIAVCLVDPTAFDAATDMAAQAGIPVIAFNADVPVGSPNKRLSYVGQPLYQSGYNSALKWLKLIPKGGHVMLSIGVPGSLNTQPRLDGYIQAIKDSNSGVTYDVVNTGPDPATEISRVESYYLSHKTVNGLFGTGGSDTYACGFVSNKYGLVKAGVRWPASTSSRRRWTSSRPATSTSPPTSRPICRASCRSSRCISTNCRAALSARPTATPARPMSPRTMSTLMSASPASRAAATSSRPDTVNPVKRLPSPLHFE